MSYTVKAAVDAAVNASISTPVLPSHSTVARISMLASVCFKSTLTCETGIGWQSGMRSGVRLAAMMPATLAIPSTSPFFIWLSRISLSAVSSEKRTVQAAVAMREVTFFWAIDTMCAAPDSETWVNFGPAAPGLLSSLASWRREVENHRVLVAGVERCDQGRGLPFKRRFTLGGMASCRDGATGSTRLLVSAARSKRGMSKETREMIKKN